MRNANCEIRISTPNEESVGMRATPRILMMPGVAVCFDWALYFAPKRKTKPTDIRALF